MTDAKQIEVLANIYTNCTYSVFPIVAKATFIENGTVRCLEMPFRTVALAKKWLKQFDLNGLWIDGVGCKHK